MTSQPAPDPGQSPAPPSQNGQRVRLLPYVCWYALAAGCAVAALLAGLEEYRRHASGIGVIATPAVIMIVSFGAARRSRRKTTTGASAVELQAGRLLTRMIVTVSATAVFVMLAVTFDFAGHLVGVVQRVGM
jgi:hypothetical protein